MYFIVDKGGNLLEYLISYFCNKIYNIKTFVIKINAKDTAFQ